MNTPLKVESKEEDYKIELLQDELFNYVFTYSVAISGKHGIGKSCFAMKSSKVQFKENFFPTIFLSLLYFP